tara:strand:- start:517 stop:1245 length:729 start_codon:yes stop_codon:yes gene_type:complete
MTIKTFFFTINLDIDNTIKKYLTKISEPQQTCIYDLDNVSNKLCNLNLMDETKKIKNCNVSFIDFKTQKETKYLTYNCFWCRNKFNNIGIGCPLKYIPASTTIRYKSCISKNTYTINESLTDTKIKNIKFTEDTGYSKHIYETDGIFCSFNCCLAHIKDNKHDYKYNKSEYLLYKMYNEFSIDTKSEITPAPDWKLLKEYGGTLSIEKYRDNFNNIEYVYNGLIKDILIIPIISLYEKNIKI